MPLTFTVLRCPDTVAPETRALAGGEFTVGRGPGVDWVLPDPERLLSKHHFAVAYRGGAWQIADTSTNGTFLNTDADPIGRGQVRTLRDGDRVKLGAYEIEVRLSEDVAHPAGGAGFRSAPSATTSPFGDPFGADPFAAPSQPPTPFGEPAYSAASSLGSAQLPPDFDPLAPEPGEEPFRGATQADHSPLLEDAFRAPSVSGQMPLHSGGTLPGDDLLPDDWDKDLLEGIAPPAPSASPAQPIQRGQPIPPAQRDQSRPPGQSAQWDQSHPPGQSAEWDQSLPPGQSAEWDQSLPPGQSAQWDQPIPPAQPAQRDQAVPPPQPTQWDQSFPPGQPAVQPVQRTQSLPSAPPGQAAPRPGAQPPFPQEEPGLPTGGEAGLAASNPFDERVAQPPPAASPAGEPDADPASPFAPVSRGNAALAHAPAAAAARDSAAAPAASPHPAAVAPPNDAAQQAGGSGDAALLAAFLDGAGLADAQLVDPVATMRALGEAFRSMVAGVRAVLIARASVKSEFRIEQTMIQARGNNPLKFSAGDDDALAALLGAGRRTDMTAAAAVTDALKDIRLHELASMAAMQSAVRALLDGLDPARLRAQAEQGGGLSVLSAQRKARAWDAYEALHATTVQALSDDFDSVFGKAFARAYEQAMQDVSAKERR